MDDETPPPMVPAAQPPPGWIPQDLLAAIVDSSDDAIVSKTVAGTIMSWNRGAEAIYGYRSEEALGRHITLIIPADRHAEEEEVVARIRRGERVDHFETVRRRKDGSLVDISLTVSPVRDAAGRIIGASKVARDITERKRSEAEVARIQSELLRAEQRAREEAESANRGKDQFLAMLGHELRNPLGAISSAISVLDRISPPDDRAFRSRQVIERQVRHLARIVDDLVDVARVMTGKVLLSRQAVNLAECVERCLAVFSATGRTHAYRVSLDLLSVWTNADLTRLEQIVTNLLENAFKYTPPAGLIDIRTDAEGDEAILRVQDSGRGIAADLLPRIFDLFVQGERALDRAQGGLGVGLTLVRSLAELHGGAIEAASPGPGLGSTFTVRLPRCGSPAVLGAVPTGSPSATLRVLVVEDHDDARTLLRMLLEMLGHDVYEAADGADGLDAVIRLRPDVALIDIGLPKIDGYELARRVRDTPGCQTMHLVAISGYGQPEDRRRATEAGFDDYVIKPVEEARLSEILRMAARRRA